MRDEIVNVERLREDLVHSRWRVGGRRDLGKRCQEQHRDTLPVRIAAEQVENIEPVQTRELDIEYHQVRTPSGDGVHHKSAIRDDVGLDIQPLGEDESKELGDVRIILGDDDPFQATRSARIRRKRRSLTQTLQVHMADLLCSHHATWHVRCSGKRG